MRVRQSLRLLNRAQSARPAAVVRAFCSEPDASARTENSSSKSRLLHSLQELSDAEIASLVVEGKIPAYKLETELKKSLDKGGDPDCTRAVRVRRRWLAMQVAKYGARDRAVAAAEGEDFLEELEPTESDTKISKSAATKQEEIDHLEQLPYAEHDFDGLYQQVLGNNCELVIGYVPIPVGVVGPLTLNGKANFVPMATTEGALVASTNRGCRAIEISGGCHSSVYNDGMTRAPVLRLPSARKAVEMKLWLEEPENFRKVTEAFEGTSRYAKLLDLKVSVSGRFVFARFKCFTGDAMGMNMISKAVLASMEVIEAEFPDLDMLSLSGNVCTDKKPSAINWIEGRGKSVVCEVTLSGHVVTDTLKCTVKSLVDLNVAKNLVGSAVAGSIGGNNAHASNIVTAVYLATGQDPAQNVESSNCMTLMESVNDGKDLHVSVTMPSVEVGTIGGGTSLPAQSACLDLLGVRGAHPTTPGENATQLAQVVAASVLAGEISLMSALASNHLVSAHLKLNRKKSD